MNSLEKVGRLVETQNSEIAARAKAAADLAAAESQVAEPSIKIGRQAIRAIRKLQKEHGPYLEMVRQVNCDEEQATGSIDTTKRFYDARARFAASLDDKRIRDIEKWIEDLQADPKSIAAGNIRYNLECTSGAAASVWQNYYQLELMIDGLNNFRARGGKSKIVSWGPAPSTERAPGTKPNVKTDYDVFATKG